MAEENGIYVMMPVKCIGKACAECPYLYVDTNQLTNYDNGNVAYSVHLRCRGLNRCLRIQQVLSDSASLAVKADKIVAEEKNDNKGIL